ncbi:MAG: site-2 protease family protein [Patescibacteria group bacterium]
MMDGDIVGFVFQIAILVMSVVVHEVSHGFMAYALGDSTAKYAGRLTLNPIPHIDPMGSILLPLMLAIFHSPVMIGYARPVPINLHNIRNKTWGPILVSAVGPFANALVAACFSLLIRIGLFPEQMVIFFAYIILTNLTLGIFNLLPIPPLDGSKVLVSLLPWRYQQYVYQYEQFGFFILIAFIYFFSKIIWHVSVYSFVFLTGSEDLLIQVIRMLR